MLSSQKSINEQLVAAAYYGDLVKVNLLLDNKADIHYSVDGDTALTQAAKVSNKRILRLLLDRKADINHANSFGDTALLIAAGKYDSVNMVDLLLEHKADVEHRNHEHYSALDLASLCLSPIHNYYTLESVQIALLKKYREQKQFKTDVTPPFDLEEALINAVTKKRTQMLCELLTSKVPLNFGKDTNANSPLALAVFKGDKCAAQLLLDHKADINYQNKEGFTALHTAVSLSKYSMVPLLLKNGSALHLKTTDDKTALDLAEDNTMSQMIQNEEKSRSESYKEQKKQIELLFLGEERGLSFSGRLFSKKIKPEFTLPTVLVEVIDDYLKPPGMTKK